MLHIHQHLDIFVDGKPVEVPGDLGIGDGFISDLHTHASYPPGIIHVESPDRRALQPRPVLRRMGRAAERDVHRQPLREGRQAAEGVGQRQARRGRSDADRARAEHQQIVLAYGTPAQEPKPVPATYDWPEGV